MRPRGAGRRADVTAARAALKHLGRAVEHLTKPVTYHISAQADRNAPLAARSMTP